MSCSHFISPFSQWSVGARNNKKKKFSKTGKKNKVSVASESESEGEQSQPEEGTLVNKIIKIKMTSVFAKGQFCYK